jgi:hypothetical protein
MPNWCYNTLTLSGDADVISRIKDLYKQSDKTKESDKTEVGLFGLFYPLPDELKDTKSPSLEPNKALIEKYGADNWYDFQTKNWGVKWDVREFYTEAETENEIRLSFDTAWAPPIAFYEKLSADYPELIISASYYEGGCDFCGTWESDFGEETLSISDIQKKCLSTYKRTYKDNVDGLKFRERLEDIYETNFPISGDINVYEIFPDYYFEEKLDAEFCKEYNITKESQ